MNQKNINSQYEIILLLVNGRSYGRAISKKLGISLSTTQRILRELVNSNILDHQIEGRNNIYSIKNNLIAKLQLYNAERYKLSKLLARHLNLLPLFSEILNKIPSNLIILFGSFADFSAGKSSDIDIFAETSDKSILSLLSSINPRIDAKIGTFDALTPLGSEITRNHIVLKGIEEFYERCGFFKDAEKERQN